jgi:hypothetical protein
VVDEQAGEHEPRGGPGSGTSDENADRDRRPVAGHVVAHEPDRERAGGCADPLNHPPRDQHLDRVCERADERAGGERPEGDEQQATLAVEVAQAAQNRRSGDCSEEKPGQQPRGRRKRSLLQPLNRGNERHDHELLEAEVEGGNRKHPHGGSFPSGDCVHDVPLSRLNGLNPSTCAGFEPRCHGSPG